MRTSPSYARPKWPGQEHPQQYHLDFRVPDLEKATDHAIELGATRAEEQPNEKLWRVMIDPDGHPFCLCRLATELSGSGDHIGWLPDSLMTEIGVAGLGMWLSG